MKSTPALRTFAIVVLVFYGLYALSTMGMTGVLFSAAIGFFLYAYTKQFEMAAMGAVLAGIIVYIGTRYLPVIRKSNEGFTDSAEVIAKRVAEIKKPIQATTLEPEGVLSSQYAEAFADYNANSNMTMQSYNGLMEGFADVPAAEKKEEKPAATAAASAPAPATPVAEKKEEKPAATAEEKKEKFENNPAEAPAGLEFLFKPGETPTEKKGGYHIDAGTTILNALNGLKPNQIEAMTADTQKLMETQKSLLGMLNTMKPMLADVKPLMETFGTLFAK